MSFVTHSIIDHSKEVSPVKHYLEPINTGLSWAQFQQAAGNGATENIGLLRLALAAITDGNFVKHRVTAVDGGRPFVLPTSPNAQRENKLLISARSTITGQRLFWEIPGPNLAVLGQPGTDDVDLTGAEMAALVTWIENNAIAWNEENVTVLYAKIVGRRL